MEIVKLFPKLQKGKHLGCKKISHHELMKWLKLTHTDEKIDAHRWKLKMFAK